MEVLRALGRTPDPNDPAVVKETAAKLLGQLFFGPMLAEMRKLPFGEKFSNGGRTEEIFGEQLDTRIADAIASSDPGGLTTSLAKRLHRGGRVSDRSAPSPTLPAPGTERASWPARIRADRAASLVNP